MYRNTFRVFIGHPIVRVIGGIFNEQAGIMPAVESLSNTLANNKTSTGMLNVITLNHLNFCGSVAEALTIYLAAAFTSGNQTVISPLPRFAHE